MLGEFQKVLAVLEPSCHHVDLILSSGKSVEVEFPGLAGDDVLYGLFSSHQGDSRLRNRITRPIHDPAVDVTNSWGPVYTHIGNGWRWESARDKQDRELAYY